MKASLFLLFIQLVTLISAAPTNHKKGKGKGKNSGDDGDDGDDVDNVINNSAEGILGLIRSAVNYNVNVAQPVTSVQISGQNFSLSIDTGSGLTVVGMSTTFIESNTTVPEGKVFFSNFDGGLVVKSHVSITVTDTMNLLTINEESLVITNASIGVVSVLAPPSLTEIDGFLGLALQKSTKANFADGTVVPTVMDLALQQQQVTSEEVGLSFSFPKSLDPQDSLNVGEITYGGLNASLICGELNFTDLSKGADLWTLDSPQVSLGDTSLATNVTLTLDSSTLKVLLPEQMFNQYVQLSGGTLDSNGTIHFSQDQVDKLSDLIFEAGGVSYKLVAKAQVFPQQLNEAPGFGGSSPNDIIGVVGNSGPAQGNSSLTLGQAFLVEHYALFDVGGKSVGLAVAVNSIQGCPQ